MTLAGIALLLLHPGAAVDATAALQPEHLPKLVVFDLDDTLWTPSLSSVSRTLRDVPQAEKHVILYPEAKQALVELATCERWRVAGTRVAVASRTRRARWAKALLGEFELPVGPASAPARLADLVAFAEIHNAEKTTHFRALREASNVPFESMLFLDDLHTQRCSNLAPVAELGVFAAHVGARGLTQATWRAAVAAYAARRAAGASGGAVLLQNGDVLSAADAAPRRARHPVYRPSRPKHARSRLSRRDRRRLALLDQVAARSEADGSRGARGDARAQRF